MTPDPIAVSSATATATETASASAPPCVTGSSSSAPLPQAWERVPDIEYVPTPQNVVDKMLDVMKLTKTDVLYDLGSGDGRIPITAAKKYGIKAVGFDIDPIRVKESRENVKKACVEHLVTIELKDIFNVDLTPASVVSLYLLPELNVKLIPQLEKLATGSRIVSHDFDMAGVDPENTWTLMAPHHRKDADGTYHDREHYVYLWKIPLKKIAVKNAGVAAKPDAGVKKK